MGISKIGIGEISSRELGQVRDWWVFKLRREFGSCTLHIPPVSRCGRGTLMWRVQTRPQASYRLLTLLQTSGF